MVRCSSFERAQNRTSVSESISILRLAGYYLLVRIISGFLLHPPAHTLKSPNQRRKRMLCHAIMISGHRLSRLYWAGLVWSGSWKSAATDSLGGTWEDMLGPASTLYTFLPGSPGSGRIEKQKAITFPALAAFTQDGSLVPWQTPFYSTVCA